MWTIKKSFGKYYNLARCVWGMFIVLALLAQAAIPAGMMPDFKAQGQGIFKLTICSGTGMKTIDVPTDNYNPDQPSPPMHDNSPCPYAVAVSTANIVLAVLVLLFVEVARVLWIGLPTIVRESKSLLTNIYPRAPPYFS